MIKKKIREELLRIGYNPIHLGTIYLLDAIEILLNKPNNNLNLEKDIYVKLSKKYNKNKKTIQSNISKATNCIILNEEYLKQEYNLTIIKNMTLTPKIVIVSIIEKIKERL